MDIQIKRVTVEDLDSLQQISIQTFVETFASSNSEENMKKYEEEALAIDKLMAELNNPDSEFYFAVINENVIGYLKINFGAAQTEKQNENAMEIERIYVLSSYHGKKLGQLLYDHAIQIARDKNCRYVWLGVWEENHRAIQFYKKNGFVEFDKHIFKLGDDLQTDIMMKLDL
jgi:ribosomal protein S18 acetylase RimI-like enzyme